MSTQEAASVGVDATHEGPVRRGRVGAIARWLGSGPVGVAVVVALTLFTLMVLPLQERLSPVDRDADAVAVVLVQLAAAVTVLRARRPVGAAVLVGGLVGAYLALGYPYGPLFGFVVLTVYTVARNRPLLHSAGASAAVYLLLLVHVLTNDAALDGVAGLVPGFAWVAIPFTVGVARRAVVASHQRERAVSDQRLVDAERLRLSQEVHDVVGHGLAAIQMQADITLHLSDPRPEQTRAALQAISEASRAALDELRVTLATVHRGEDGAAPRAPTPGLAEVDRLCRRVEESGVAVRVEVDGRPEPLPQAADVVAYRVLQESLTNVLKHSAHQLADVRIVHGPDTVTVEVTNQDVGADPVEGIGITGMRRRVEGLGGTFRAGPGASGATFRVRATIPRSPESSAP